MNLLDPTVGLVLRREIAERTRTRAYRISTLIQVVIIVGIVALNAALGGGSTEYDLGVVRGDSPQLVTAAQKVQDGFDATLNIKTYATTSQLRQAVADKDVDAALAGRRLLVRDDTDDALQALLQTAAQRGPPALSVDRVGGADDDASGLAFVSSLLLYLALLTFGYALAASIVEEKSTRVIELLLSAVRPGQLLAGKIIGVGVTGLAQLLAVVGSGLVAALVAGQIDLPNATVGGALLVLLFFVLGYAFYACAFAAASSLVSRQEDIQSVTSPLMLLLVGGYLVSIGTVDDPSSSLAQVGTFIPPLAPLIVPGRALHSAISTPALIASVVLMVVATALVMVAAARIYRAAVMRTGAPVRWRDALRLMR